MPKTWPLFIIEKWSAKSQNIRLESRECTFVVPTKKSPIFNINGKKWCVT